VEHVARVTARARIGRDTGSSGLGEERYVSRPGDTALKAASHAAARGADRAGPIGWLPCPTRDVRRSHAFQPRSTGNPKNMSPRYRNGTNQAGKVIAIVADVMAFILGLWILMYLLDANRANDLVQFVHDAANWLAGWSHDLFTFDEAWARVVAGYGLAAVVYLFVGHAIAHRIHRH